MSYASLLPPPNFKKSTYTNGDTDDIIDEVIKCYNLNHQQAQQLALKLKGSNLQSTCSNIWHFIKKNVRYKIDPEGYQWVRTPSRLVADGEGDCKSFSVLAASLLKCLGITPTFRFTSYSKAATPTHVYVVVKQPKSKEIIIDAVIDGFNTQKPYTHKKDLTMAKIATLSGVNNTTTFFEQSKAINAAILKSLLPAIAQAEAKKNAGYIKTPLLQSINKAIQKVDGAAIGSFNPAILQANQSWQSTTPLSNAQSATQGVNWSSVISNAANMFTGNNTPLQTASGLVSTGLNFLGPVGSAASGMISVITNMFAGSNPDEDWKGWDALDRQYGNNPPGYQAINHIQQMGTYTPQDVARATKNILSWINSKGTQEAFNLFKAYDAIVPNKPLTPQQIYNALKSGGQEAGGMALANAYSYFINPNAPLPYQTSNVLNAANNLSNGTGTGNDGFSAATSNSSSWLLPVVGGLIAAKVFKII